MSASNCVLVLFVADILLALTPADILTLSHKFWQLHSDPIFGVDGAAATLLTLQYNCCAGTLAMFAPEQPAIDDILRLVLAYEVMSVSCSFWEVVHILIVLLEACSASQKSAMVLTSYIWRLLLHYSKMENSISTHP